MQGSIQLAGGTGISVTASKRKRNLHLSAAASKTHTTVPWSKRAEFESLCLNTVADLVFMFFLRLLGISTAGAARWLPTALRGVHESNADNKRQCGFDKCDKAVPLTSK